MTDIQALFLGILQGLTEFLPVSSSGHLELGNHFLHTLQGENLTFTLTVHAATVLSTIAVFRNDILNLFKGLFSFSNNEQTRYIFLLLVSSVPVAILGLFFREEVEQAFTGNLVLVGSCLVLTAVLLTLAHFKKGAKNNRIGLADAIVIGLAQACAILPGLSRSGSTIATGLLLGKGRTETARFSFLMVLLPVLGAFFLDILKGNPGPQAGPGFTPLLIGFMAAFISGFLACRWMIKIVGKGKLIYFAIYCLIIGLVAIFTA